MKPLWIGTLLLVGCTLNYRGDEDDYNIKATVKTPACEVTIDRSENKAKKKADVEKTSE